MTQSPIGRTTFVSANRWLSLISILVFLAIWEVVARQKIINPLLFPPPTEVAVAIWDWALSGDLLTDLGTTMWRLFVGLLLGGVTGSLVGLATGRNRRLSAAFNPIIQFLRPLPPVAIIPLIIVWFGIGNVAKIFAISYGVFFPVWINTHLGASQIPVDYIRMGKLLSSSRWKRFRKIILPAALPEMVSGWRNSIAMAFIMAYVSELAGASQGVGYRIDINYLAYRIDRMMAALVILAILGALSDWLFTQAIHKIFPWIKMRRSTD